MCGVAKRDTVTTLRGMRGNTSKIDCRNSSWFEAFDDAAKFEDCLDSGIAIVIGVAMLAGVILVMSIIGVFVIIISAARANPRACRRGNHAIAHHQTLLPVQEESSSAMYG